ncbi:MAG TPA: hypothetical protein PK402_03315 [Tepidisphaeraceae bacterium]|nr:hypothetical protein [Tepidisphaeraceae bacterium]
MSKRAFLLLLPFALASCASPADPQAKVESDSSTVSAQVKPRDSQPTVASTPAQPANTSRSVPSTPAFPQGARFTISCTEFTGGDHVRQAMQMRDSLVRSSGMNGWYVIHEAGNNRSLIRYGYYKEINLANATDRDSKRDAERAAADIKRIQELRDATGRQMFGPVPVPLDVPDPTSPPEWNLVNCPKAWTLQIAAYAGGPERKKVAVDMVREARAAGVEAYYFHGENVSSVCIGSWDESAVEVLGGDAEAKRDMIGDTLIVSLIPLSDDTAPTKSYSKGGNITTVVQTTVRIKDESLKAMAKQYPQHYTNGEADGMQARDKATGRTVIRPKPSLLVRIPHDIVLPENAGQNQQPELLQGDKARDVTGGLRGIND